MRTATTHKVTNPTHGRETLREAVRTRRKERGLSQVELSTRAQVHPSTISLLERGAMVSDETIARVAEVLGLELAELRA